MVSKVTEIFVKLLLKTMGRVARLKLAFVSSNHGQDLAITPGRPLHIYYKVEMTVSRGLSPVLDASPLDVFYLRAELKFAANRV
jgi:hypothetical protein